MASIELDIIKQRCDKLLPQEKLDLIAYLTASLTSKRSAKLSASSKPGGIDSSKKQDHKKKSK